MSTSLDDLQYVLGYSFNRIEYLEQALTHRSVGPTNNERLEFLGDAVLNFRIAHKLFDALPDSNEGELSRIRASLVNREALVGLAADLGLSVNIKLGPGEKQNGGQRRGSIQSDVVEALLGAVLLDGGFDACSDVIDRLYQSRFSHLPDAQDLKDPKTCLQEYLQSRKLGLPRYTVTSETGKDHAKYFEISCEVVGLKVTLGRGTSRRKAEQDAASKVLGQLEDGG